MITKKKSSLNKVNQELVWSMSTLQVTFNPLDPAQPIWHVPFLAKEFI